MSLSRFVRSRAAAAFFLLHAAVCGAFGPLIPDASAQEGQSVVVTGQKHPSPWLRVESEHVIAYTDARSEEAVALLENLEKLDYLLRTFTKPYLKLRPGIGKLTLYYYADASVWQQAHPDQPSEAVWLYGQCALDVDGVGEQLGSITPLRNEDLGKATLEEGLSAAFEAYARHFLYRYTAIRAPLSFIEGYAQYFASVRFSDERVLLGRAPRGPGKYLRFLDDGHRYSLRYADILDRPDEPSVNYGGVAGSKLEFNAKSWILAHYILSSETNRGHLTDYLVQVHHGAPAGAAFEHSFGIKVDDLDTAMWRYWHLTAVAEQDKVLGMPQAQVAVRHLPASFGDQLRVREALQACPAKEKEWTVAHERVMQLVEYNAGLEAAQSYLQGLSLNADPSKALQTVPSKR